MFGCSNEELFGEPVKLHHLQIFLSCRQTAADPSSVHANLRVLGQLAKFHPGLLLLRTWAQGGHLLF